MKLGSRLCFCTLMLAACSIEVSLLENPAATSPASTQSASTIAATAPMMTNETAAAIAELVMATGEAITLPAFEENAAALDGSVANLGLTGKLLFTQGTSGLWQADLDRGTLTQLLALPEGGHIGGIAIAPDGDHLALAYGPPPEIGPQRFLTDLYLVNIGNRDLHPLLLRTARVETYANPVWSPDGQWLYYSHLKQIEGASDVSLNVERFALAGNGKPEIVVENGHQPALSFDMTHLAFLHFDQDAKTNALWTAALDGSQAREVLPGDAFADILAPRFSGDGSTIAFGASGTTEASAPSFWDRLFGIKVAYAHGAPWALWSIDTTGGDPQHLTLPVFDGTWPAWSPDGQDLVFMEAAGIYWVSTDGLKLLAPSTREGEIVWVR